MASVIAAPTSDDISKVRALVAHRSAGELNRDDRDDIAGEVISDAWVAATKHGGPFVPLASTTARRPRYYTDARKDIRSNRTVHQPDDTGFAAKALSANPLTTGQSADRPGCRRSEPLDVHEEIEILDLVSRLPYNQSRAFMLVHWLGYTLKDAAVEMDVSFKTIDRWQAQARQSLADAFAAAEAA